MDEREQLRQALEKLMLGLTGARPIEPELPAPPSAERLMPMCRMTYDMYDCFQKAGFDSDQAFELTAIITQTMIENHK